MTTKRGGGGGGRVRKYARRARDTGERLLQSWSTYFMTPMIDRNGNTPAYPTYAYVVHLILASFSEALCRVIISFVFVMALAGLNGGTINFTLAVLAKAAALSGSMVILGRLSAYCRFENVLASWWPSSHRMLSTGSIQPYVDFIHILAYLVFQYLGSLLGLGLAMWVSDAATINSGQPSSISDAFGLFGIYPVTISDLWLIEMYGSAMITFAWLMLVVYQEGAYHHIYAGLSMFLVVAAVAGVTISASGANFDFIHYAALRTVLAGKGGVNNRHWTAYLFAPLIGAVIAWVGYLIVAWLSLSAGYTRPGIVSHSHSHNHNSKNIPSNALFSKSGLGPRALNDKSVVHKTGLRMRN